MVGEGQGTWDPKEANGDCCAAGEGETASEQHRWNTFYHYDNITDTNELGQDWYYSSCTGPKELTQPKRKRRH